MCIFCSIVAGDIPAKVIDTNTGAVAFLDITPRAVGHTLIVPKVHAETIEELSNENVEHVFTLTRDIVKRLKKVFSPDGFTIGINHGKSAGQAVEHMHVHVIPRWSSDGGSSIHSIVQNIPTESLDDIALKIKKSA